VSLRLERSANTLWLALTLTVFEYGRQHRLLNTANDHTNFWAVDELTPLAFALCGPSLWFLPFNFVSPLPHSLRCGLKGMAWRPKRRSGLRPDCVKTCPMRHTYSIVFRGLTYEAFFQEKSRTQTTLLPECLDDYVTEGIPARVTDAFVDQLDLGPLRFEGVEPAATGRPAITAGCCSRSTTTVMMDCVLSSRVGPHLCVV